jgi:hypothetical protein
MEVTMSDTFAEGRVDVGAIVTADQITATDWLHLIQAEYLEMPGQQLTRSQIKRLWGLDSNMCDAVLQELLDAHFLRHTLCDAYVLDGASHWRPQRGAHLLRQSSTDSRIRRTPGTAGAIVGSPEFGQEMVV